MLAGQRPSTGGEILVEGEAYDRTRAAAQRLGVYCLPEEPLRNACVPRMSVAENLDFRRFDRRPDGKISLWLDFRDMARNARAQIARYQIKTASKDSPIASLSGGNVQRSVLARELSGGAQAADRRQPLLRPRLPGRGRHPLADRRGQEPRCRRAADLRGPRRDPGAVRPHPGHERRQDRLRDRRPRLPTRTCSARTWPATTDARDRGRAVPVPVAAGQAGAGRDRHAARLRRARRLRRTRSATTSPACRRSCPPCAA